MNAVKQSPGLVLRRARSLSGLSQTDLAQRLGLGTGQNISNWERDYGPRIPPSTLRKICEILNIDPKEFFEPYLALEMERLREKLEKEWRDLIRQR